MNTVIIIILVCICLFTAVGLLLSRSKRRKSKEDQLRNPESVEIEQTNEWKPSFHLKHNSFLAYNIPFVPDKKEVFYLENEYNKAANKFVRENISYINKLFAKKGLRFTYLPDKKLNLWRIDIFARYFNPCYIARMPGNSGGENKEIVVKDGTISIKSNFLLDYLAKPEDRENIKSCFAWFNSEKTDEKNKERTYVFDYISFDVAEALENPKDVLDEIFPEVGENYVQSRGKSVNVKQEDEKSRQKYYADKFENELASSFDFPWEHFHHDSENGVKDKGNEDLQSLIINSEDYAQHDPNKPIILRERTLSVSEYKDVNFDLADEQFDDIEALDSETRRTLIEVQQKLTSVRLNGISEAIIAKFIKPLPRLSMIVITHDFHFFLTNYGNMEITMEPLVKSVYILFLRHPEGIMFKELFDYCKELEIIYRCVKVKRNVIDRLLDSDIPLKISKNVLSLCNPMKNSINEKCTRIKEAFISKFSDYLAQNYYITGSKATVKKITLPRHYVHWEKE